MYIKRSIYWSDIYLIGVLKIKLLFLFLATYRIFQIKTPQEKEHNLLIMQLGNILSSVI